MFSAECQMYSPPRSRHRHLSFHMCKIECITFYTSLPHGDDHLPMLPRLMHGSVTHYLRVICDSSHLPSYLSSNET